MAKSRRQTLAETVEWGLDGFLFHRFERTFEQVCGGLVLKRRPLERWLSLLEARHAWCTARRIRSIFFVVPEKHVIYRDKLPQHNISPVRPAKVILRGLAPTMRPDVVYPVRQLVDARKVDETYFRTDVHWTPWGAYVGYRALLHALSTTHLLEPIPQRSLIRGRARTTGDLGIRVDEEPSEEYTTITADTAPFKKMFGNRAFTSGQVEVYETGDPTKPRAVLFRDSNATAILPFLVPHFSRLTVVASQIFFHELVRSERPDIVVLQTTERQLARPLTTGADEALIFPDDFGTLGFTEFTGMALPLPEAKDVLVVDFKDGGDSANYRGAGWSHQEQDFVWMIGDHSTLKLPVSPRRSGYELQLDVCPAVMPPRVPFQRLTVEVNGISLGTQEVRLPETLTFTISLNLENANQLNFMLRHPDAVVPADEGSSQDIRVLSLRVTELRLISGA